LVHWLKVRHASCRTSLETAQSWRSLGAVRERVGVWTACIQILGAASSDILTDQIIQLIKTNAEV